MGQEQRQLVEAAVLIPLYRRAGDLRVVLIRRSEVGAHGGHLAFPGGKRDAGDRSTLDTALRETQEEVGIGPERIEILAELPPTETRSTSFRIYPFIGRIIQPVEWHRNEREVAEILDVSLAGLAAAEVHVDAGPHAHHAPYYRVGEYRLWGVSYRILQGLMPRLLRGEWNV